MREISFRLRDTKMNMKRLGDYEPTKLEIVLEVPLWFGEMIIKLVKEKSNALRKAYGKELQDLKTENDGLKDCLLTRDAYIEELKKRIITVCDEIELPKKRKMIYLTPNWGDEVNKGYNACLTKVTEAIEKVRKGE